MIKHSLSDRYKVDPYGTEEIISSAANSCAPILTIDYGDEVQTDVEFTIRPTKGSLDTNISDVAIVGPIKGNTVSWNQLYDNTVPTAVSGHKYFIREKNGSTVAKSISTTISYTADSTERNCIDLTLIYNAGNEPLTPEAFEADYYKWFGKQLTYEDYDAGSLRNCKMSGIKTTDGNSNLLCINPIPVTSLKGRLNGQGSSVVVFPDGLNCVRSACDNIIALNATKTIYTIVFDGTENFWEFAAGSFRTGIAGNLYPKPKAVIVGERGNGICSHFGLSAQASGLPTENQWDITDPFTYRGICFNKSLVPSLVNSTDATGWKAWLAAQYAAGTPLTVSYELETPEVYILDAFDVQKMMLGANEVQKVYLGSDVIFQSQS